MANLYSIFFFQVDTDFLQTMCQRLFANQLRQSVSASVDLRRPGTAGNILRQSVAVSKVRVTVGMSLLECHCQSVTFSVSLSERHCQCVNVSVSQSAGHY